MRFLHLSDLHLGKRVCEFSMLEDQRYILEEILALLDETPVDGVLLAGDLYDKPVPPAEAVRLLDWFLTQLAARKLPVFAISGNHDSADRVAFGSALLADSRVYVSPVFTGAPQPIPLQDAHGTVDVYLLPFLKPAMVRHVWPDEPIESYNDALACVLKQGVAYTYYEGQCKRVADITSCLKVKEGIMKNFLIKDAAIADHFAYEFRTLIYISKRGVYRFYTISDDGSKLYIDDKLIVDNDGGHSVRRAEGKVALEKGYHALHLLYFENYMGQELEVGFLGRDIPETPIPAEMLFLPD